MNAYEANGKNNCAYQIGEEAAIIKWNGQTDEYVKEYVLDQLADGDMMSFKSVARQGYAAMMRQLKTAKPGLFAYLTFDRDLTFVANPCHSKWVSKHLNESLAPLLA